MPKPQIPPLWSPTENSWSISNVPYDHTLNSHSERTSTHTSQDKKRMHGQQVTLHCFLQLSLREVKEAIIYPTCWCRKDVRCLNSAKQAHKPSRRSTTVPFIFAQRTLLTLSTVVRRSKKKKKILFWSLGYKLMLNVLLSLINIANRPVESVFQSYHY